MKIYFEKFGEGCEFDYFTPMKLYEVVDRVGDLVTIKDDVGDDIWVTLNSEALVGSPWKAAPEPEPETVASLKSERNALANSIDSVNELLDSLDVPKAETLRERVSSALTDKGTIAGTTEAHIAWRSSSIDRLGRVLVRVSMKTESGEIVFFDAIAQNDRPKFDPAWPAASSKEGE